MLPLIFKKEDPLLDFYLTGKIGGITISRMKSLEEHCIGGGATVYLSRHLGTFGEYNYGNFLKKDINNFGAFLYNPVYNKVNLGLAVKFE